jgi:hypothetical protein
MVQQLTLQQRFHALAETWSAETRHMSSSTDRAMHPAYQQIIGLGPAAIPLLLEELQQKPGHWSWALRAITGENPVKEQHRGKLALVTQDWLEWGKANGFLH